MTARVTPGGLAAGEATVRVLPRNYGAAHSTYVTVSVADGAGEISKIVLLALNVRHCPYTETMLACTASSAASDE